MGQRNFGAEVNTDGTYGAACGTGPAAKGSSDTLPMVFWVRNYKHRNQIVPKPLELKLVHEDQNIIDPKQMELKKKKHRRNNQEHFPSINGIQKWRDIWHTQLMVEFSALNSRCTNL